MFKNPVPCKIVEIKLDRVTVHNVQRHNVSVEFADIKPISLSPEILEKNGFTLSSEHAHFYFSEDNQTMSFCLRKMYDKSDKFCWYASLCCNIISPIKYVHQLQHALRLCGIEKEIQL